MDGCIFMSARHFQYCISHAYEMNMSNTYLNKTHMLFATIVINGGTIWKVKVNRIQIYSVKSVFLFRIVDNCEIKRLEY